MQDDEQKIFDLITHAGVGRGMLYDALTSGEEGKYDEVEKILEEAKKELSIAHNVQTELIQKDLSGDLEKVSLILIHAQDQFMATETETALIEHMIKMQKEINALKDKINELEK